MIRNRAVAVRLYGPEAGTVLMGRRRDSGKWTLPAGHLEPGEEPAEGARRELWEEAGMRCSRMRLVRVRLTPGGYVLYVFDARPVGAPRLGLDPDLEFDRLDWMDPDKVELHHPRGSNAALDD